MESLTACSGNNLGLCFSNFHFIWSKVWSYTAAVYYGALLGVGDIWYKIRIGIKDRRVFRCRLGMVVTALGDTGLLIFRRI